jgi:hypothetical protein
VDLEARKLKSKNQSNIVKSLQTKMKCVERKQKDTDIKQKNTQRKLLESLLVDADDMKLLKKIKELQRKGLF